MKTSPLIIILYLLTGCRNASDKALETVETNKSKTCKEFIIHLFVLDDNNEGDASFRLNGLSLLNDTLYYLPSEKGLSLNFSVVDSIHFRKTEEIAEKMEIKDPAIYNRMKFLSEKLEDLECLRGDFSQYHCGLGKSEFDIQVKYNDGSQRRFSIPEPLACKAPNELLKGLMAISSFLRSK